MHERVAGGECSNANQTPAHIALSWRAVFVLLPVDPASITALRCPIVPSRSIKDACRSIAQHITTSNRWLESLRLASSPGRL
jgi:hypothetical protein